MSNNKMYFKITNENENHNQFQYKNGLNILNRSFEPTGTCVAGGFYFTNIENLHKYYEYGVWIRIVTIPSNAKKVIDPAGDKWRSDKIILNEKYPLYDIETIKKFNLVITEYYIRMVIRLGKVDILNYLYFIIKPLFDIHINQDIITYASEEGHADILDWWKHSDLPLKYPNIKTGLALLYASYNGHINILDWFKNNANDDIFILEYDEMHIEWATYEGHIKVLDWWKHSGLKFKYPENILCNVMHYIPNKIKVIEWWKNTLHTVDISS